MKSSNPNIEIRGAPIGGDLIFRAICVAQKHADASMLLLNSLVEVGAVVHQVALHLLRQCSGFCKLARSTPPAVVGEALQYFDNDVHHCFSELHSHRHASPSIETSPTQSKQKWPWGL